MESDGVEEIVARGFLQLQRARAISRNLKQAAGIIVSLWVIAVLTALGEPGLASLIFFGGGANVMVVGVALIALRWLLELSADRNELALITFELDDE